MNYTFLRINLNERSQLGLLDDAFPAREDYIKNIFGEEFRFMHQSKLFVYEPVHVIGSYISGFIGTQTKKDTRVGPDDGWQHEEHEHWATYNILIDAREHPDGQKVAFRHGRMTALEGFFASLSDFINKRHHSAPWYMNIGTIGSDQQYVDMALTYRGKIAKLEYRVLAKNMDYRIDKNVKEGVDLWNELGVDYMDHTGVAAEGSVDAEGELAKQVASYAQQSGGSVKAWDARGNVLYNSKSQNETKNIDNDFDIEASTGASLIKGLLEKLFDYYDGK